MAKLTWKGRARIVRWSHDHWKLAAPTDPPGLASIARDVDIVVEVHPSEGGGCHLVMSPDACFTADYWYASESEAMEAARELLGVPASAWKRPA